MQKDIKFVACTHGCDGGKAHGRYYVDGRVLNTPPICSMTMGLHVAANHPEFEGRRAEEFVDQLKAAGLPDTHFGEDEDVRFVTTARLVDGAYTTRGAGQPDLSRLFGGSRLRKPEVMSVMQIGNTLLATIALPGGGIAIAEIERVDGPGES